jgi:hypothetical protein
MTCGSGRPSLGSAVRLGGFYTSGHDAAEFSEEATTEAQRSWASEFCCQRTAGWPALRDSAGTPLLADLRIARRRHGIGFAIGVGRLFSADTCSDELRDLQFAWRTSVSERVLGDPRQTRRDFASGGGSVANSSKRAFGPRRLQVSDTRVRPPRDVTGDFTGVISLNAVWGQFPSAQPCGRGPYYRRHGR